MRVRSFDARFKTDRELPLQLMNTELIDGRQEDVEKRSADAIRNDAVWQMLQGRQTGRKSCFLNPLLLHVRTRNQSDAGPPSDKRPAAITDIVPIAIQTFELEAKTNFP